MRDFKLTEKDKVYTKGSSKGTQIKYFRDNLWFKTNNAGEGIAEELTTRVLECSNVQNFVRYERCLINGKNGCFSSNFLKNGECFISFQRLYQNYIGGNLSDKIRSFRTPKERYDFLLHFLEETTELNCNNYLCNIFGLDLLILNPDRHFHNLGVIFKTDGSFREAPIFDNGQGLGMNFDITPPDLTIEEKVEILTAATISGSFEEQLLASGNILQIDYQKLHQILETYPNSMAKELLLYQLEKYKAIFELKIREI